MLKKVFSTFLARFLNAASNFAIAILVSHFTGAAGRGEQSLFITLITFIIIVSSMIGSGSLSYLIPRFPFSVLIIPVYLWALIIPACCLFFLPYTNLVPDEYIIHVCLLSFMLSVFNAHMSVLIARQRINMSNLLTVLQSVIILVVLAIMFAGFGERTIRSYIVSLYFGYGISFLISLWVIRMYFKFRKDEVSWFAALKNLAELGFYNQVAVFTQMLSFRLSYYILNKYMGSGEVGIYSNAVSVAESIWLIGRSIAVVQHSKIVNSNDDSFSRELTLRMNRLNLYISVTLLIILSAIPSSWFIWIFGSEFGDINSIIWTLGPGILFFGIALIFGYYFSSTGSHYVNAIGSMAGLVATLILGFILIPRFESYGAGITASVSYGITALVVYLFFRKQKKNYSQKFL